MFGWFYKWLAQKLSSHVASWLPVYIQIGGHCGICGRWIPNAVVEVVWPWTLCDKCAKCEIS